MNQKPSSMPPQPNPQPDTDHTLRKQQMIVQMADIVLSEGLNNLSLRALAARLETSDRMLLYYFKTKDLLVRTVLDEVNRRLTIILAAESTGPRLTATQFLSRVLALTSDPAVAPFMQIWTDVIARGARGLQPYADIARTVVNSWTTWINSRLISSPDDNPENDMARATFLLACVEGVMLLAQVNPEGLQPGKTNIAHIVDSLFRIPGP